MTPERLTTELVVRAMRWRLAPGRHLKAGLSWTSRSGFRPLVDVNHAFQVLDAVTDEYSLVAEPGGRITVVVHLAGRTWRASGTLKAQTICMAVAQALGIDLESSG